MIALLLCLMMALTAALPAMGAELSREERIRKLAGLFQAYIDQEKFVNYPYDEEEELFSGTFKLDSALNECKIYAFIYHDMLAIRAFSNLKVPAAHRDNMAKFLMMANSELAYSYFLMNFETGEISSRSMQVIEEVFPTLAEIDVLHYMPLLDLDEWGNGIVKVSAGADPLVTFQETVKEIAEAD